MKGDALIRPPEAVASYGGFFMAHSWLRESEGRIRQAGHAMPVYSSIRSFQNAVSPENKHYNTIYTQTRFSQANQQVYCIMTFEVFVPTSTTTFTHPIE